MQNEMLSSILQNIKTVKDTVADNTTNNVDIVLATKGVDKDTLSSLAMHNKFIFGENRVQEFVQKHFLHPNIKWHFIGQLQSNKVKYIIDKADLIQSVDRLSLAKEIDKQAKKHNIVANVLIQINLTEEQSRGGVFEKDALKFIHTVDGFDNISIKGIMCLMPNTNGDALSKYYLQLHTLYDTIKKSFDCNIPYLSAGMSKDYIIAVKHGANMIRIGRAIFG